MTNPDDNPLVEKPRHFFGLLCAHQWDYVGDRERKWASGKFESFPVLQCRYCGNMKVFK